MADHRNIFDVIVKEAVRRKAADVILTCHCQPVLNLGSGIQKMTALPVMTDALLGSIVRSIIPAGLAKKLEALRQVDFAYEQKGYRFRINVFYQRGHLSLVARYVQNEIKSVEDLGLPEIVKDLIGNDNGLLLVVGPTGSGKSTSLASMVEHLNKTTNKHIITIEDPVEYVYENKSCIIEQREIGSDAVDFPTALRSTLREAPDVILLGEMRDLESISTAITVAETGHLVLSTIHANSAAGSIDRMIDVFPAGYKEQIRIQLADILIGVLNQRLVPAVNGGYALMVEVMIANSAVRNAIRGSNTAQLPSIIQTSSSEGMCLLDDLLVRAAEKGDISKEYALAYAQDRATVKKSL